MRYLDIDTATGISKIGLGTWQFGAKEWGYGPGYAEVVARDIVRRPCPEEGAGSVVDEGSVIKVGVRQGLPFLVVLKQVRPGLLVALLEQDVLRSHDVAGAEVLRIAERAPFHPGVGRPPATAMNHEVRDSDSGGRPGHRGRRVATDHRR
jgi:hypothetical protein